MAQNQTLQHKRTTIAGRQPTTSQVDTGELALNLADYSIYTNNGTSIIELARDLIKAPTAPTSASEGDLWYNTTTDTLNLYNGVTWSPLVYQGRQVLPGNTTFSTAPSSGSGTSAAPYIFTVSVSPGQKLVVTTVTVTGLTPNQLVPIQDTNQASNGGRFTASNNLADSGGTLRFNIVFNDLPVSLPGASIVANFTVGTGTVYIDITAIMASTFPQAVTFPTNTTATTTTWSSPADTLTATNDIEISINGVTYTQGPLAITTGNTLYTMWLGAAGSGIGIDSSHGTTITGTITSSVSAGSTTSSLTIDKTPDTITFTAVTGAGVSTVADSNTVTISGVNSYLYLTSADTASASIGGSAFSVIPASGTSQYLINGQTLQLRQTSSATVNTTTTVTVAVGGGSTSFSVTTVATGTINTPSITSPLNGSTNISSTATITSSAYAVTGLVGAHLNTDWEIYNNSGLTGLPVTSSMASTTNLTTWTPTGLSKSTQYWIRVRYRSADSVAVVSAWSPTTTWTTRAQLGITWTVRSGANGAAIAWSGTQLMAVADTSSTTYRSTDGITWTAGSSGATMNGLTYGDGKWLAAGDGPVVRTSADGITWIARTVPLTENIWCVTWGGTKFVVPDHTLGVTTSTDGITWTTPVTPPSDFHCISSDGTVVAGAGHEGIISYSLNQGATWASKDTGLAGAISAIASNGTKWVVGTNRGDRWTSTNNPPTVGSSGTFSGIFSEVNGIAWGDGLFVAVGNAGKIATSPDGVAWTTRTSGTTSTLLAVTFTGTQFVIVGSSAVLTSF